MKEIYDGRLRMGSSQIQGNGKDGTAKYTKYAKGGEGRRRYSISKGQ
jgi:hypothetical protein